MQAILTLEAFLQKYKELQDDLLAAKKKIEENVRVKNPEIQELLLDVVRSKGKMLRPLFFFISARFGDFSLETAAAYAAALELVHTASLVHDDVIDDAPTRRNKATLHTKIGTRDAVLMGDFLLSRCFLLTSENSPYENARSLAHAVNIVCVSEIEQDLAKFTFHSSVRTTKRIMAGKTASLFAASCHAGAVEGKLSDLERQTLRRIGFATGMAFQLIDDILDFESTESVMGKPILNDLKEGLCTLPLVFALQSKEKESIKALLSQDSLQIQENRLKIASLVRLSGAIKKARDEAKLYTDRALRELSKLRSCKQKEMLKDLVFLLLQRTM